MRCARPLNRSMTLNNNNNRRDYSASKRMYTDNDYERTSPLKGAKRSQSANKTGRGFNDSYSTPHKS